MRWVFGFGLKIMYDRHSSGRLLFGCGSRLSASPHTTTTAAIDPSKIGPAAIVASAGFAASRGEEKSPPPPQGLLSKSSHARPWHCRIYSSGGIVTEFGDPQRQGELDKHAVVPPYITCWLAPTCSVPEVAQTQRARVAAVAWRGQHGGGGGRERTWCRTHFNGPLELRVWGKVSEFT
jgi:hypothetical protein